MTPKEKAVQLITLFTYQREEHEFFVAKECAKSCVNEIIQENKAWQEAIKQNTGQIAESKYWEKVKNEIEKL